ncbi:Palmitoyltransferase [Aphelenchoides bicaudatus]|nr:Palmitoyltransferase [Aphelenchoides bicaudatus]
MNSLLFLQIFHYSYAYYVYIFIVCREMIDSQVQICIYSAVFHTLLLMLSWSLFQVLITPVKNPPPEFKVPNKYHELICWYKPKDNDGNLQLDKPTKHQIKALEYVRDCLNLENDMAEIDFDGRLRYCYVCKAFKPDRARHCSSCGKCVLRLDHHCPWLNKCISHSNHKFFLLFSFYSFALNTWLLLTSIGPMFAFIYNMSRSEQAIQVFQLGISLASQAYFGFYIVGGLAIYHLVLCSENETTCERAKRPVFRGDECAGYDCGVYENYQLIFGYKFWLFPIRTTFDDGCSFSDQLFQ